MSARSERLDLIALIAGPTVWAVGFSVLYGIQGAGCQLGWEGVLIGPLDLLRGLLLLVWAAHLAVLVWMVRWTHRRAYSPPDQRFFRFGAFSLALTGLVAMVWTGLPVVFTSACLT